MGASYGSLALATGDDGLWEYEILSQYPSHWINEKKNPSQLTSRHCTDCNWSFYSIFGSSSLGHGFLATYKRHEGDAAQSSMHRTLVPGAHANMSHLQRAHPDGFAPSPADPTRWLLTLEGTVRHMYFEAITHLYNIQRLKCAQGLPVCVDLLRVGYYVLPGWDNDLS